MTLIGEQFPKLASGFRPTERAADFAATWTPNRNPYIGKRARRIEDAEDWTPESESPYSTTCVPMGIVAVNTVNDKPIHL